MHEERWTAAKCTSFSFSKNLELSHLVTSVKRCKKIHQASANSGDTGLTLQRLARTKISKKTLNCGEEKRKCQRGITQLFPLKQTVTVYSKERVNFDQTGDTLKPVFAKMTAVKFEVKAKYLYFLSPM